MEEQKYTIAEDFELPSKGLIYEKPVESHVRLKSMTMRDELKRTAPTTYQYKILSEIIEGCMLEKPAISVYDMCIGDFDYLLHKLRIVTHSEKYLMTAICPNCGSIEDIEVDLNQEKTINFDYEEFKELLKLKLKSGKEITLKYHTPRILDNIKNKAEERRKKSKDTANIDFEKLISIEESIDLVDGVKLTYTQKENFINSLSASDYNKIDKRLEKINTSIGLKNEIPFTCSKCNQEVMTFFRFGPEFFRPSNNE